jgi:DNA-binding MarR family transcriptional regulator
MNEAVTDSRAEAIEAVRKQVLGRLLLLARESFFARMEAATAHLFDASTLRACGTLMPFIDVKGTRSTELARRMGISKQAVGRTIKVLVDGGLVECATDPEDGRAFLVKFTRAGMKRMADMHAAIRRVERDLEHEIGAERMRVTRDVLFEMAYGKSAAPAAARTSRARPRP